MKKILVAGYFGEGNLGDDAILVGFLEGLKNRGFEPIVMSGSPIDTERLYGVPCIPRRDLRTYNETVQQVDALVFAGGSIFQDVSSFRSVAYYSSLVQTARKAKKSIVLLGQGIGPIKTLLGKKFATRAFNQCNLIAVRDPGSIGTLKSLGVKVVPRVTGDLAWLLPKPSVDPNVQNFQAAGMRAIGISARPFGKDKSMPLLFGQLAKAILDRKLIPVLIEMDAKHDRPLILEIEKAQGGKIPSLKNMTTPMQVQQRLLRLDGLIAMRLHAGILGMTCGLRPGMLSYDPKVTEFAKLADLPCLPMGPAAQPERIVETMLPKILGEKTGEDLVERYHFREAAMANIDLLVECLA